MIERFPAAAARLSWPSCSRKLRVQFDGESTTDDPSVECGWRDTRVTCNWSCSSRQSNDGENILQANIFRKSYWSALLFCLSIVIYHRCFQALWDIRRAKNAVLSNIKEIRYLKFLEKIAIFCRVLDYTLKYFAEHAQTCLCWSAGLARLTPGSRPSSSQLFDQA